MIIKKNTHAPLRFPRFYTEHQPIRYEIEFTESCKYRFGTDDDNDINKLFGVAFITWGSVWFTLKSIGRVIVKRKLSEFKSLHHYNSFRFGWRYNPLMNEFESFEYGYKNGVRFFEYMESFLVGDVMRLSLIPVGYVLGSGMQYYMGSNRLDYEYYPAPEKCLMYQLHPYFGGNRKATQDMEIKMKRL